MALKKCRECGTEVSEQAKVCPKCGIQNPVKRSSLFAKILLALIALFVIGGILPRLASTPSKTTPAAPSSASGAAPPTQAETTPTSSAPSPASQPNWHYEQQQDSMQNGTNKFASVMSANEFSFDFPYAGSQHAILTLRKHVRHGKDVLLQIQRGQFLCPIRSCTVTVRFDDANGQSFTATEPSDNASTLLFIEPFEKFYSSMLKSKRVRFEATFFQQGNRTLDFDVSGFDSKQF
ncbi:zinc ribbon domain-containing protein [Caballeronia sp. GAFFF1]|uniref:zinc ribbon domain-containing protein n=1 Tax=Caballeronia sp. GAFFF1 TaxID=2921779 RepID=UPI0020278FC0|nr:zinc ribbon domain-containing protein [Caballeronia sp. GAFFF1]